MQALTERGWRPDYLTVRRRADLQPQAATPWWCWAPPAPGPHAPDRQFLEI